MSVKCLCAGLFDAHLTCLHKTGIVTKNGEGDLVVMDIVSFQRREKELELAATLLTVEENRLRGAVGYTIEESVSKIRAMMKEDQSA